MLSLNDPVAVNCFVVPTAMLEFAGTTAIDTRDALVTVREALPEIEPEAALIVELPTPTPVTSPVGLTTPTFVADEDHATEVSNCVLPSSKVPVAVNCSDVPTAMDAADGETEIAVKWAGTTVKLVVSVSEPTAAVITAAPGPTVVERPELLIVATAGTEDVQVTPLIRSWLDPSL